MLFLWTVFHGPSLEGSRGERCCCVCYVALMLTMTAFGTLHGMPCPDAQVPNVPDNKVCPRPARP
jgi:hypothetical protein